MGRLIQPKAIRRLSVGGDIEVLSTSGFWIKASLLSDASHEALDEVLYRDVYVLLDEFDRDIFYYDFKGAGEDDNKGDDVPPENHHKLEDVESDFDLDQDFDGTKGEQGTEGDGGDQEAEGGQGNGNGGEMTIEDIVRKIAGEMDDDQDKRNAPLIVNAMESMVDAKLAGFKPKLGDGSGGEGDLYQITTRIEISTPKGKKSKGGIFHKQFDTLTKLVAQGQHCYLPGPPGTGKSHAAEQVASVLDWRFASISLGPQTPDSRLWGGMDAHGKFFEPPFIKLARHAMENPESGSVYCLDELDNGNSGTIATLNSAMANGWFTAPNGDVITMGKNFTIVGAANTFGTGPTAEFAGRNKLDAATLDRFAYLPWDTDLAVEKALVMKYLDAAAARAWLEVWRTCRKNAKDHGLKVFVTMRGCVNGARLIASGMEPTAVLDVVLLNKLPEEQARKVKP